MITLGINSAFHDSAAAIVRDGVPLAAAEEERFTRIKHGKRPLPFTAWELPWHAIDHCLGAAGVTLGEIDHVAYSYDPSEFLQGRASGSTITLPLEPSAGDPGDWESVWDPLFASYVTNAPRQLAGGAPHHLARRFVGPRPPRYRWHFVRHHLAHQASAYLAAPFERAAVMTLDGRGERATTTYGRAVGTRYEPMGEVHMPHSLGMLYERITTHLGFLHSSDEYKVMALAAMGEPRHLEALRRIVRVGENGQYTVARFDPVEVFGPARTRGEPMTQAHFDVAASLQAILEETVLRLARWLREATGERNLAMAGGVALNCVMNSKVRDSGIFDEVWVQPAAGDAGTALGAALYVDAEAAGRARRPWTMRDAYLGPVYADEEIESFLNWTKMPWRRLENVAEETAEILAQDRIIGWFQGRMEFGPRALGGRSILASPLSADMQARLNELKDREDFRPVAPVIPQEHLAEWFGPAEANGGEAPFMLFVYDVAPGKAERIPAVCHVDHTARVQTVRRDQNERYHDLLTAFGRRTGVPVLVNTSFNVRGEPIVCTPRDAVDAFASTPIDALVIGRCLLEKGRS